MKKITIIFDQKTGQVLGLEKIPDNILSSIGSYYLHKRRNHKLTYEERVAIAKKAAKASAKVRSLKAKLGTLKKYERKIKT